MKKSVITLALVLVIAMLTGCAGTPVVYYSDCTCPTGAHTETTPVETTPASTTAPMSVRALTCCPPSMRAWPSARWRPRASPPTRAI